MCRNTRLLDGMNVSTPNTLTQVIQQIEEVVALKALNVDDNEAAWGSQRDRREIVAKSLIGHECFEQLRTDSLEYGACGHGDTSSVAWSDIVCRLSLLA